MISQENVEIQLAQQAGQLNDGLPGSSVAASLNRLAQARWLGYGVPESLGGAGGSLLDTTWKVTNVEK